MIGTYVGAAWQNHLSELDCEQYLAQVRAVLTCSAPFPIKQLMPKVKQPVKPAEQHAAEEQILLQDDPGKKKCFAQISSRKIHSSSQRYQEPEGTGRHFAKFSVLTGTSIFACINLHLTKEYLLKIYPLRIWRYQEMRNLPFACTVHFTTWHLKMWLKFVWFQLSPIRFFDAFSASQVRAALCSCYKDSSAVWSSIPQSFLTS